MSAKTKEQKKAAEPIETSASTPPTDASKLSTVEFVSLVSLLGTITDRLSRLEEASSSRDRSKRGFAGSLTLELAKVVLGGWHVFGLLVLILFYTPLNNALLSISDKMRSADEISLPGMTLKGAIKRIAVQNGVADLALTLPSLSEPALELLLKAPKDYTSLIRYTYGTNLAGPKNMVYPSLDGMRTLEELLKDGLIVVVGAVDGIENRREYTVEDLIAFTPQVERMFPGESEAEFDPYQIRLVFYSIPDEKMTLNLLLDWKLTEAGRRGIRVIVQAVAAQLAQDNAILDQNIHRNRNPQSPHPTTP